MPVSDRTYRVQGLPSDASVRDCEQILRALFDKEDGRDRIKPKVHSLGLDPYESGRNALKVATATFAYTPDTLSGEGPWNLNFSGNTTGDPPDDTETFPIKIDTDFLGFTPLNTIQDGPNIMDFIAVSGLSSHPFGSWKARGGQFMWLRDSLARDYKDARVLVYGYDTSLVRSESFQDIDDIGARLSFSIGLIRRVQPNKSDQRPGPIVFVAHSLGGLVVKEAIYDMARKDTFNYRSVYGLLFFGVPNQGIQISHWLPIVHNQPNENLIRNLAPESVYLRQLQRSFNEVFSQFDSRIVSIFETMKSKTAKEVKPGVWSLTGETDILVSRASATDSGPPSLQHHNIPFNQNHADLPKFSSRFDDDYKAVRSFLDEFRREAFDSVRTRFPKESVGTPTPPPARGTSPATMAQRLPGFVRQHKSSSNLNIARSSSPVYVQNLPEDRQSSRNHRQQDSGQIPQKSPHTGNISSNDEVADYGITILMLLVEQGSKPQEAQVKNLLNLGIDINSRDNDGCTALMNAVKMGNESMVGFLLDNGADATLMDPSGLTALAFAGSDSMIRLLETVGLRDPNRPSSLPSKALSTNQLDFKDALGNSSDDQSRDHSLDPAGGQVEKCLKCGKEFQSQHALVVHQTEHRKNDNHIETRNKSSEPISPYKNDTRIWQSVAGGVCKFLPLNGHQGQVNDVAFSTDGRLIVSAGSDKTVSMWNSNTGELLRTLKDNAEEVNVVVFSPDGELLVYGSYGGLARVWDSGIEEIVYESTNLRAPPTFSPDGKLLAIASSDRSIKLWDCAKRRIHATLEGPLVWDLTPPKIAFSPDSKFLAAAFGDKKVRIWGLSRSSIVHTDCEGHEEGVNKVAFSPRGKLIVSADVGGTIKFWTSDTGIVCSTIKCGYGSPTALEFSPDDRLVAASWPASGVVQLLDSASGSVCGTLRGHKGDVRDVSFSHDGRLLASAGHDKTIRIWEPNTRKLRIVLQGHANWVTTLAFSRDSKLLASGSSDKTIKLWDITRLAGLNRGLRG